jgi:hypothetical protein
MLSDRFRVAVEGGNLGDAADLFSEDATFRSPVLFKPYQRRDQVLNVLQAAERALGLGGEFRYLISSRMPETAWRSSEPDLDHAGGGSS